MEHEKFVKFGMFLWNVPFSIYTKFCELCAHKTGQFINLGLSPNHIDLYLLNGSIKILLITFYQEHLEMVHNRFNANQSSLFKKLKMECLQKLIKSYTSLKSHSLFCICKLAFLSHFDTEPMEVLMSNMVLQYVSWLQV